MAAFDNVSLPGAPNIAGAGNYAQMLMQAAQEIPNKYYKAKDFQYQQQQRDLFKDGIPQGPNGQPDYGAMIQKLIQSGGAPAASSLIPALMSQSAGSEVGNAITGGTPQQPNTSPTGQTAAALDKASQRTGGGGPRTPYTQPSSLSAGDDAPETTRTLAAGIANGRPISETQFRNFARAGGVGDPDAPLSPDQEARLTTIIGNNLRSSGGQSSPPATNDAASGGRPPISAAEAPQGNEQTPVGASGGSPVSPAPTAAAGGGAPQPSGPQVAQNATRPTPVGSEAEARQLQAKALQLRSIAGRIAGINPKAAEQAKDAADKADDRAKQIFESIGKFNEPGRTQRDVESGATLKAEQIKTDTERFGKVYDQTQHTADDTNKLLDTLKLTKGLMDQPSFYSGAGAEFVQSAKRIGVALGLTNPSEAQAMEAFGKTVSSAVMDQIRSLGGQGLGPVRVAEIKIMERAAQNHDNTPASNRLLTELQMRMAENWTLPIAKLAREYNNGHLDAGFDKVKQDWINKHPLLSKEELDDPRRIAPPLARTPADLDKIGWKDGMPFRTPDGRIFMHAPKPGG
jgi:hypothetical protein